MDIMWSLKVIICVAILFINFQCLVESKLSVHITSKEFTSKPFAVRSSARRVPITDGEDSGKPLYLNPYIEAGKIKKAQKLSKVKPAIGRILSYSGYLTVNKDCGNNLFFWYFPAENGSDTAPVVTWLQGGPGVTSMYGLFEELGPFNSFPEGLKMRNYSWHKNHNLLFFDQPVGTGYSFTTKGCYATNQTMVGNDLYTAIIQFLTMFPNMQKNNFFVTGESFAGHYVPAIGYTIHVNNPTAKLKINLCGMMIGDGWTDPREQIGYGDFLEQTGLVNRDVKMKMEDYQAEFVKQVDNNQWRDAYDSWSAILSLFDEYASVDVYNYLPQPPDPSNWEEFIQTPSTRKAIHVGSLSFSNFSEEVYDHLIDDMPKSVKPWVEELLEHYPIVFYVGQLDVICAYPMVINFLRSLSWSGQAQYLNAPRRHWMVGEELAGYIKGEHNLYDVLVRDAGHMVPADQPLWAYQLVNAFTRGNVSSLTTRNVYIEDNNIPYSN